MHELRGKKILYVITKSNWGGAQAYVYTLATASKEAGAEVTVAFGGTGAEGAAAGRLEHELAKARVRTLFVPSFMRDLSFLREFKVLADLVRLFNRERPDVVHLNSSKAGGIGALAARISGVKKIIFTSHGLAYDENVRMLSRGFRWLLTLATILLTHQTITLSRDTYTRARALPFCSAKLQLIYNGITHPPLWPKKEARAALVTQKNNSVWIGTIAELTPNKSLETLISAAANLRDWGHEFTLVIIGEGEERSKLTHLIEDANLGDRVHLAGFVQDAAHLLCAFDIFALVSTKEGLPYVLLEAGEARLAVVGSRIPGVTDIIDTKSGVLVTPKSVKETTEALALLIQNKTKREEFGEALYARIQAKFSIEDMVTATTNLYA